MVAWKNIVSEPVSFKVHLSQGEDIRCLQDHIGGRSLRDQLLDLEKNELAKVSH